MAWLSFLVLVIVLIGSPFGLKPALAGATPWVSTDVAQIRLIGTIRNDDLVTGLHIQLEPGWKTYWRSPGDSGLPTRIDWSGSKNVAQPALQWPLPKRAVLSGYQSFVYGDEVVLPVSARIIDPTAPVILKAAVDYAVCKDICVPLQAVLELHIDPRNETAAAARFFAKLINRFAAKVPSRKPGNGLKIKGVRVEGTGDKERLVVTLGAESFKAPDMIVEAASPYSFSAPDVRLDGAGGQAVMSFAVYGGKSGNSLKGQTVTVTAYDGDRAIERELTIPHD